MRLFIAYYNICMKQERIIGNTEKKNLLKEFGHISSFMIE